RELRSRHAAEARGFRLDYELADGPASVRQHHDLPRCTIHVLDEAVHIWLYSPSGDIWGLVESEREAVRTRATTLITDLYDEAQPLTTVSDL
ncbi:MAG: hypothetical protein V5A54_12705, partial [Haloarculaceae archaeon]